MTNYKQYLSPDGGKRITITYDEDAESPRDWDNTCTMICFHRRYSLGDKHDFRDPGEVDHSEYFDEKKYIRFPLFLLDHSGLSIKIGSFGQGFEWDSGQIGWIFAPKSEWLSDSDLEKIAYEEVKTYDMHLDGYVYGVTLESKETCECCGHVEWNDEDSCLGFFGVESAMEHAIELGLTEEWKESK